MIVPGRPQLGDRVRLRGFRFRPLGWVVDIPYSYAPQQVSVAWDNFPTAIYSSDQLQIISPLEQLAMVGISERSEEEEAE